MLFTTAGFPALSRYHSVERKNVHRPWMGACGLSGLWTSFQPSAEHLLALWIALEAWTRSLVAIDPILDAWRKLKHGRYVWPRLKSVWFGFRLSRSRWSISQLGATHSGSRSRVYRSIYQRSRQKWHRSKTHLLCPVCSVDLNLPIPSDGTEGVTTQMFSKQTSLPIHSCHWSNWYEPVVKILVIAVRKEPLRASLLVQLQFLPRKYSKVLNLRAV